MCVMQGDVERAYLVKVNLDTADVCGANGYHTEEAVLPAAEECNTLVEHEEVLQTLYHPGRDGEQIAWGPVSRPKPSDRWA